MDLSRIANYNWAEFVLEMDMQGIENSKEKCKNKGKDHGVFLSGCMLFFQLLFMARFHYGDSMPSPFDCTYEMVKERHDMMLEKGLSVRRAKLVCT